MIGIRRFAGACLIAMGLPLGTGTLGADGPSQTSRPENPFGESAWPFTLESMREPAPASPDFTGSPSEAQPKGDNGDERPSGDPDQNRVIWPEDLIAGESQSVNPYVSPVAHTNWQRPSTPPPAPATPPVPPEHRESWGDPAPGTPHSIPGPPHQESESASSNFAGSIVPWSPAPPRGVAVDLPGKQKYPSVAITGFFQADMVAFDQDDANRQALGDIPNGADFRRARLAAKGDVWQDVGYMIEMDFATAGRPSFMDVYMDLREVPWLPGTLRIGQWRQPFGMASLTSVRELSFLERPLQQALVPFRQIGIGLIDPDTQNNTTWAVSGFRFPTDFYGGNVGDSGGLSFATRETMVFGGHNDTAPLVHIGGDYSYLNSSFDQFAYFTQPEIFVSEVPGPRVRLTEPLQVPRFVDTGAIDASQGNLFGAELAGRRGSFWAQAESYLLALDHVSNDNPVFWGAYLQAGYILTGEVKPYSKANGVFTRVKPANPLSRAGGMGAWEVAGRISTLDLTDGDILGGQLTDVSVGLNWYLNVRTKFQFNYIHAFLDRFPVGKSHANVLAARAQIDF